MIVNGLTSICRVVHAAGTFMAGYVGLGGGVSVGAITWEGDSRRGGSETMSCIRAETWIPC